MNSTRALFLLIAISSIPVIVVYVWFRLAKYQYSLVRFLFILLAGAAAFFPALILQNYLNFSIFAGGRINLFYQVFIRIAFTEELSRLLMLLVFFVISSRFTPDRSDKFPSRNAVKKRAATGLVAGLGFAFFENAVYGASNSGILMLRAFTSAPLHAACGFRVGWAAAVFKTNPIQAVFRFFTAVVIHGIYNLMTAMSGIAPIMAVLIAITAFASSIAAISGSSERETESEAEENQNYYN